MARRYNTLNDYRYEDVMKRDRFSYSIIPKNSQFKGNMNELAHHKDEDDEVIVLCNSYYSGFSRQEYSIKNNTSELTYHYNILLPKYLRAKMNEFEKHILSNIRLPKNHIDGIVSNNHKLELMLNSWAFDIKVTEHHKGFVFKNNLHNIEFLKHMQQLMKRIKKIIKYNSCDELMSTYLKTKLDENVVYLSQNKFLKLKQDDRL